MGIGSWLAEQLFSGGRALVAKVDAYNRTRTKAQQKRELEAWGRNHMPGLDWLGRCAVCDKPRAVDTEHCAGPVLRWHATRRETAKCLALYEHRNDQAALPSKRFVPGCEICDPSYAGPRS